MNSFLLVILGLLGLYTWRAGGWAKQKARESRGLRSLLIWGSLIAIPAGVLIALVLPEQIDFNRESPGGIFYIYLPCFLVGGGLAFGGLGAFFGAISTTPEQE